ncbi:hypothetical protein WDW86_10995, partial [Bdellovibrionota bacterium FG-2]
AAVQETVSSLDEVGAMIEQNSQNANLSHEWSETCAEAVNQGKAAVEKVISSMADMTQSNAAIVAQVESNHQEITDFVQVISEISSKTKVISE